jgi:hypothetical protein
LFENGNSAENFSAIVKRREITLASLLQKIDCFNKDCRERITYKSQKSGGQKN